MNAEEIINFIATSEKKTPVKLYIREKPGQKIDYAANVAKGQVKVFGSRKGKIVFGDWADLQPVWRKMPIASTITKSKTIAGIPPCRCWTKRASMRALSPAPSFATRLKSAITPSS